jgi:hypothetical protein
VLEERSPKVHGRSGSIRPRDEIQLSSFPLVTSTLDSFWSDSNFIPQLITSGDQPLCS